MHCAGMYFPTGERDGALNLAVELELVPIRLPLGEHFEMHLSKPQIVRAKVMPVSK